MTDKRAEAHAAFARREWETAYSLFRECDEMDATDYDALAESAHWLGRVEEVLECYSEAYRLHLEARTPRRASQSAFMLAIYTRLVGKGAQADGWLARIQRLLADEEEGPEHGYPLYLETARLMGVDLDAAFASAQRMQDLGRRFGDDTLLALGVFYEGRTLIKQARVREGLALLDEAMLAALSDKLKPMWTGAIYCGLIAACHELVDHRRAREWTDATREWCSPLPVASLYPGICRVHTAELMAVRGAWEQAEAEALQACEDMLGIDVFAVADGWYEVGEIRRRRGDLDGAEAAYTRAHEVGRYRRPLREHRPARRRPNLSGRGRPRARPRGGGAGVAPRGIRSLARARRAPRGGADTGAAFGGLSGPGRCRCRHPRVRRRPVGVRAPRGHRRFAGPRATARSGVRADLARDPGTATGGGGKEQPRGCRGTGAQRENRGPSRLEHLHQARCVVALGGDGVRLLDDLVSR